MAFYTFFIIEVGGMSTPTVRRFRMVWRKGMKRLWREGVQAGGAERLFPHFAAGLVTVGVALFLGFLFAVRYRHCQVPSGSHFCRLPGHYVTLFLFLSL